MGTCCRSTSSRLKKRRAGWPMSPRLDEMVKKACASYAYKKVCRTRWSRVGTCHCAQHAALSQCRSVQYAASRVRASFKSSKHDRSTTATKLSPLCTKLLLMLVLKTCSSDLHA